MDSIIEKVLSHNSRYAATYSGERSPVPKLKLAILCCMDHRLTTTLIPALGLGPDDADIITNAGGIATDDATRSLVLSQGAKGTTRIMVIGHTKCGMKFPDINKAVQDSVDKLRNTTELPHRNDIHGFVFDLDSGRLVPVEPQVTLATKSRGL